MTHSSARGHPARVTPANVRGALAMNSRVLAMNRVEVLRMCCGPA